MTLKPGFLSHGDMPFASVIFRQNTPCNERGQGTNAGPKRRKWVTSSEQKNTIDRWCFSICNRKATGGRARKRSGAIFNLAHVSQTRTEVIHPAWGLLARSKR